jgi:hypothetical protein
VVEPEVLNPVHCHSFDWAAPMVSTAAKANNFASHGVLLDGEFI